MRKPWQCPKCGKPFHSKKSALQHGRDAHGIQIAPVKRAKPKREDSEPSLADISVEAHLKQAMGEPLDPLEESLISN